MALQISGASFALLYRRTNSKSIDSTEVWTTLADALAYAANTDDVKYVPIDGLVISVTENNKTYRLVPDESISTEDGKKHYKLEEFALAKDIVSKNLFSSIFGLIDENGNELSLYDDNVIDLTKSIKAKFGLWTELYLSALGMNPADGEVSLTLASLNDVLFSELTEGLSIVWNGTKWINQLIESGGLDESLLEDYLSRNNYATTLDITDAISSKVDTTTFNSAVSTINIRIDNVITDINTELDTKATKTELTEAVTTLEQSISDVDDDLLTFKTTTEENLATKLDIAFFSKVFGLIGEDGSEIIIDNDTSVTIESIQAKFGLWTELFLSAKGLNPSDGSVTGISLKDLAGVNISSPLNGEGLIYQDGYWVNQVVQTGEDGNPFYVWQGESEAAPTLKNAPANQWTTTTLKNEHIDDYYITTKGLVYLFTNANGTYSWELVTDKYLIDCWDKLSEMDDKLSQFDGDLTLRVEALEQGSATKIEVTGSGNVVTDVSKQGTSITVTKGVNLGDYLPLTGGTMKNQNKVTNLNADLIDGIDSTSLCVYKASEGTDINTLYNYGMYRIKSAKNSPTGAPYITGLLTIPYRNASGNSKTDFAAQILLPNGDDTKYPNDMLFRTSLDNSWNSWQRVVTDKNINVFTNVLENDIATLKGYFTNGVANSAIKLSDNTAYTAWGLTFFENGKPKSVSGALTNVTDITASGTITADMIIGTSGVSTLSDRKFKTDIKPLEDRGSVQPVTFVKDGKKSIGFIAQDVQEKYPELVYDNGDYLSLNYQQYTAVLLQLIIDLLREVNELKQLIKLLL